LSSILKALKKLEQDRPQADYPRLWVRRNRGASSRHMWLGGLIVLGLLAVAGATLSLKRNEAIRPLAPVPVGRQAHGSSSSAGGSDRSVPVGVSGKTAPARSGGAATGLSNAAPAQGDNGADLEGRTHVEQTKAAAENNRQAPAQKRAAELEPLNSKDGRPVGTMVPKASAEKPLNLSSGHVRRAETVSPGTAMPLATKQRAAAAVREQAPLLPVKLLADTDLKIQAISWSVNPEDRIAVISSRIVREGQTIDGFRVKQINIDDMLLTRDGMDWMLKFVNN